MTSVRLGPVARCVPAATRAVARLPELATLTEGQRTHALSLGIDSVPVAGDTAAADLAHTAAETALRAAGLAAADLDALLLVQGRAPDYLLASEATALQHRLGAARAFTTGIGDLGCVSVSAALELGAALLRGGGRYRTVLVVTAATAPTPARYRPPMTILGDGAAAVLLTTDGAGRYELVDHIVRSNGQYADLFRIDYRDVPTAEWVEECADETAYSFRLAVESRTRFTDLRNEILDRNNLGHSDIAAYLMQNLGAGAVEFWQQALGVPIDPACRRNLARYGHLGPVDVLVNAEDAAAARTPGDYTMVLNSGPVAAWSIALLRRLPEPQEVRWSW
ncbi:3-oxoacyl-ACP synthase [Nocardia blacklockiae]|uniref:3-oxoacyl-ACP synthase n=1 Tax=Nocardia blacklockiae TaxID=480036 RepID=UPI00189494FA|nr:3-oxoacyl-ACP synthase [Nocardia blacklockiae]MBF6175775.1 3-oxoacyl-ACP synthase [Nocardia blacklockiae]